MGGQGDWCSLPSSCPRSSQFQVVWLSPQNPREADEQPCPAPHHFGNQQSSPSLQRPPGSTGVALPTSQGKTQRSTQADLPEWTSPVKSPVRPCNPDRCPVLAHCCKLIPTWSSDTGQVSLISGHTVPHPSGTTKVALPSYKLRKLRGNMHFQHVVPRAASKPVSRKPHSTGGTASPITPAANPLGIHGYGQH